MAYEFGNPYSLFLFVTAAFSMGVAVVLARYRSERAVVPLVGILFGAAIWAFGDAMLISATTEAAVRRWYSVSYLGAVIIAPAALLFAAAITGRDHWFDPRPLGALVAISAATYLVVLTTPYHDLWRTSITIAPGAIPAVISEQLGIVHVVWIAYVLLFVVPLSVWMILTDRRYDPGEKRHRRRTAVLLVAFLIPTVSSTLYVTGVVAVDPTPFGLLLTGIAFTVAVVRYEVLDLIPIARATVLESMQSGVVVMDRENTIVDANDRAKAMIDLDDEAVVGQSADDILQTQPVDADRFRDVRNTEETVAVTEDGETRYYDVRISPIEREREYLGRVGIFDDVTERVERRERLQARTAALERQNERLDEFASMVSHDLRNPLNVAVAAIELAQLNEDVAELDRAEAALDRIDSLIDEMLVLSRTGTEQLEPTPVDLETVASEAWAQVAADGASLQLNGSVPSLEAERTQLRHLLANLFRNAVEHNDPPVTVTVGGVSTDGEGFFVADDGVGVPEEERSTIFEHGYSTSANGTGFGLSIVRHVAEAHGWEVTVDEGSDGGARFEFMAE